MEISRACLLLCACLLAGLLPSCQSTNRLLKAKAVPLSAFIEHPAAMETHRERAPFHKVWSEPDPEVRHRAALQREIFIAPVTLQYLRPVKKALARNEILIGSIDRKEQAMAQQLRTEFAMAFARSPQPRYRLVRTPTPASVTVELAITELNPTSPKGNAVKTAAKFVVGPLAGLGGYFTKGNMAIEGKVRNTGTGELVFEFADNEADRMTFYTLRDFRSYGHATQAIKDWAAQFELFTRTPPSTLVKDSWFFTLDPR